MADGQSRIISLPSDSNHSGRDLGAEELIYLRQVLESGTLNSTKGTFVSGLEKEFAARFGKRYAYACSSGSAAVHVAIAALNTEPGDEIVTTPITDMGGLTCILYQGAIPVFCDVDPDSYTVTAETIEPRLTKRTRAVIVTHLFGVPCELDPILELCRDRRIPVIEDCAQAIDATYRNRVVGTMGSVACFSFQQGKHMTTGEGGMVMTDDADLARRMFLFINKAWGYGDRNPDHYFLALNYRMNELTGAVGLAQLHKLSGVIERRRRAAGQMRECIREIPGVSAQAFPPDSEPVYWRFCVNIDSQVTGMTIDEVAARMRADGIPVAPGYVRRPAFECRNLAERITFGSSGWPYTDPSRAGLPPVDHDPANFPGTMKALSRILVIPWNEFFTGEHVSFIADSLRAAVTAEVHHI